MKYLTWVPVLLLGLLLEFVGSELKDYAKKQINPPDEDDDDPE